MVNVNETTFHAMRGNAKDMQKRYKEVRRLRHIKRYMGAIVAVSFAGVQGADEDAGVCCDDDTMQEGREGESERDKDKGVIVAKMIQHHQPDGIANANILDFSGWEIWGPSVTPNTGDRSTPRIFAFGSGPPTGVAGEPDDAGEVVLEKLGEGVSGVLG